MYDSWRVSLYMTMLQDVTLHSGERDFIFYYKVSVDLYLSKRRFLVFHDISVLAKLLGK